MTLDQQLAFCKKCTNRKMDFQQGILCNLTDRKPDFTDECPNFNLDEHVKEVVSEEAIAEENHKIIANISDKHLDKFRGEQNFQMALFSGILVGLIGALLWGMITVSTGYQIGYMAIAIGAGVGFSMRYFGKGVDQIFGITGAIIAVLSCALGNLLSIVGFAAEYGDLSYFDALAQIDYSVLFEIMGESFSFMDVIFYGIAAYEGYKFAFRAFTQEEINEIAESSK
ncbi:hypothetical protein RQM59_08080 [Flavobacteriaceae bacterium S356]|uniref:Uncharacterized protein n=1 Tax=Asprobacillus argus TaxID=3076534 RepID=A0ABU3LF34_9FLAO|nr:hypothetical protein [Flavobacteriaceae bacterium S356]